MKLYIHKMKLKVLTKFVFVIKTDFLVEIRASSIALRNWIVFLMRNCS